MSESVTHWLSNAARYPLLSKSQAIELARTIQESQNHPDPDPRLRRRAERAKKKLIECNLRLVVNVSKRYTRRIQNTSLSLEDLLQEGCIGLDKACTKFNPELGYAFSTYAYNWIVQSMQRFCELHRGAMRASLPITQMAIRWKYRAPEMTAEEFAYQEGITIAKLRESLELYRRAQTTSLDRKALDRESNSNSIADCIADDASEPDLESMDYVNAMKHLQDIPELRDHLAVIELNLSHKPKEMADLLGCSIPMLKKSVEDSRAVVREHAGEGMRSLIVAKEPRRSRHLTAQTETAQVLDVASVLPLELDELQKVA